MENNEEQLEKVIDANLDAVEHNESEENVKGKEITFGSSKKFKSVEALVSAYENLEKEFTKKCQKLNEVLSENNNKKEELPQYKQEDWVLKVNQFLKDNEYAKEHLDEIAEILSSDENLSKKEDALELAYSKVLKRNFVAKEQLAKSEEFLSEFVYNNEEIKNKIIQEYLFNIQNNKTIPLISDIKGSLSVSSPKFMPKNLTEAGRYAENILKK